MIETVTHGRVLLRQPAGGSPAGLLVAFHGYGQDAEEILDDVVGIPGLGDWRMASVQGLHRFYTRKDRRVVASWMTHQDRNQMIVDNVAYVQRVLDDVREGGEPVVFVGFSQGASMAYRAAVLGRHEAVGVVALAGDVPPELKQPQAPRQWPPVLIGVGSRETWLSPEKIDADVAFLESVNVPCDVARFDGGHEWTREFQEKAGAWISARASTRPSRP